jgi:hypothetical protein
MFFVCLGVGYMLREVSLRNLDITQAGTLVMALRPIRIRLAIVAGCVLAVFVLIRFAFPSIVNSPFVAIVFPLLFLAVVIAQVAGRIALVHAQLPHAFVRLYGVSQVFDFLGYGSLLGAMTASTLLYGHA